MTLYLVSNNLVMDNICYESDATIEEKRISRPLSIEGENLARKIINQLDGSVIYSSNYASAIATSKYYADLKDESVIIDSKLNDSKIGKVGNRNIKMLRFMQERDFNFKFETGESLNETGNRINNAINNIIKKHMDKDIVIFTHKRAILSYLIKYLDKGYNLDDRLILSFNDKVIIDDVESAIDIIKIEMDNGKIINVDIKEVN